MGQVLHGSTRTTEAARLAIQNSQKSIRVLPACYGINPKTVVDWQKRKSVNDARMGLKKLAFTVLTHDDEILTVAFHKHTLLSLDDCLYIL